MIYRYVFVVIKAFHNHDKFSFIVVIFGLAVGITSCDLFQENKYNSWETYRGNKKSNAYSELSIINKDNVSKMDVAWVFRTGDSSSGRSTIQCNPLIVEDLMYLTSSSLKVYALNAATGEKVWEFDPFPASGKGGTNRGLTWWEGKGKKRLFYCARHYLIAIDPKTGTTALEFGVNGMVDLRTGLGRDSVTSKRRNITNSSPGIIFNNLLILGSTVGEDYGSMPGHIRAFDVENGEQEWIFHTIPMPEEPGYNTWPDKFYLSGGGVNAWAGLSLDEERGIVYAPLGSPTHDFYGGDRSGMGLYGNSILALEAETGKYKWHFQVSHHDLWDYDIPAPPNLVTINHNGERVDAVAQITKQGFVFLFDRETGNHLFEVEEIPVPPSTVEGEHAWPTQPFPSKPTPLARQYFDKELVTVISPEAHQFVTKQLEGYTMGGIYLPPSIAGTVQIPGFRGGGEWSGGAFDEETGILYVGINDIPNLVQVVKDHSSSIEINEFDQLMVAGEKIYEERCASCHGIDRKGSVTFPSLINLKERVQVKNVIELLTNGRGMMPPFPDLSDISRKAILSYLYENELDNQEVARLLPDMKSQQKKEEKNPENITKRYRLKSYQQLRDQNGYPGIKPPWGSLCAVDLNTAEIKWKIPLGEYQELTAQGIPPTGTQLFGGGIVTKGGLIFIGASRDEKFRALDKDNGKILWEFQLPAGGYATPSTYAVGGEQFVVIAAGGGGMQGTKTGDYFFAFKLKE